MKLFVTLALFLFVLSQQLAYGQSPYGTNAFGAPVLLPTGSGISSGNSSTPAPATNAVTTVTNTSSSSSVFTNASGYGVSLSDTNVSSGAMITIMWTNPDFPVINVLDQVALYRIEGTRATPVESHYIVGNRTEQFTILTPGTYRIAYVKFYNTIKAWSLPFTVGLFILSYEKTTNWLVLSWPSRAYKTYGVQSSENLRSTNWTTLVEQKGVGARMSVLVPNIGATVFYRLYER